MDDILRPTSPYKKKKRVFEVPPNEVVPAPQRERKKGPSPFWKLPHHRFPRDTRQLIMRCKLENALQKPDTDVMLYAKFWTDILWASEYHAYEDIKLYDMEDVHLKREGRFMALHVPGPAEGRPSVLRGDEINVTWNGSCAASALNAAFAAQDQPGLQANLLPFSLRCCG